jgi:plastocyanin
MGPRLLALSRFGMMACATPMPVVERIRVTIDKLRFSPAEISAHAGDVIEWVSSDFVADTATARSKDRDVAISARGALASGCSISAKSIISVAFIRI